MGEVKGMISSLRSTVQAQGERVSGQSIFDEVRDHQLAKGFDHKLRLYIVLEGVCGTNMDAKAVMDNAKLIGKFIRNANMPTADVLWALDTYVCANPGASKWAPRVLKTFYDEDWAEEAEILSYYNESEGSGEPGFEEVRRVSGPFLKWLEMTASDDDADDDNESEQKECESD